MTSLVVTLIGQDRTGIIQEVADVAAAHKANWLESQMADLAGQFAGIVHLDVEDSTINALKIALESLGKDGLQVNAVQAEGSSHSNSREIDLVLLGQDRPGIVREIATALSGIGVNIAELETDTVNAPMSGEVLFKASARLKLPENLSLSEVDKQLESVSNELMVDINLDDGNASR